MSEKAVKKLLAKAYSVSGKILGREFNMYRPVMLDDAMSDANFVGKQYATFTLSKSFVDPQPEGFKQFTVFTDHRNLQPGDIFSDDYETFVIAWNRGIEDCVAIRAGDLVTVERAGWSTAGGLKPVLAPIASNVPASVIGISSQSDNRISQVNPSAPTIRWELRILAKKADIKTTDNIRLSDDTLLRVDSVTHTELFTSLVCSEVKE